MIEQKIAEIKEKYTLLKGVAVKDESDTHTVWLVVGNQQFVLDSYWSKEEGEWQRDMLAKAILALIAEEQKPLVEALEAAQTELTAQLKEAGQCDHYINFCVCPLIKILEQIDTALKGIGR